MTMKDALISRIDSSSSIEMKYRINRRKYKNHIFFEGKTDKIYYMEMFRKISFPLDGFAVYECGNRDNVLYAASRLPRQPNERCAFFVDHDEVVPQSLGTNVYVTSGYSFENSLVNRKAFSNLVRRNCGVASLEELEHYLEKFDRFISTAAISLRRVMRLKRYMLSVGFGRSWKKIDVNFYCGLRSDGTVSINKENCKKSNTVREFNAYDYKRMCKAHFVQGLPGAVYGKGLLRLFVKFFDSVCHLCKHSGNDPVFIKDQPDENVAMILAPLCDAPDDLERFMVAAYQN